MKTRAMTLWARTVGAIAAAGWLTAGAAGQSVFTLIDPPVDFEVLDFQPFDGVGDSGPWSAFNTVGLGTEGDDRELAEFDISGIVVPDGEEVVEATYEVQITSILVSGLGVESGNTPDQLSVYGYAGDGVDSMADFQAGEYLSSADTSNPFVGQIVRFDVTSFLSEMLGRKEPFAGLAIRGDEVGLMAIFENGQYPRLTITTDVAGDCYADCDASGGLDLFDFLCFQNDFVDGGDYSDCEGNNIHDLFDFLCYQNEFVGGC
jgi:hypothetical protein